MNEYCYDFTGKGHDEYARCDNKKNSAHSACCANNKPHPDICLESGLCLSTTPAQMGFLYEDGCTDITMSDDACPKVCKDVRRSDWTVAEVLQCEKGKWCCREAGNGTNCCDDTDALVAQSAIGWMVPSIYRAIKEANSALVNGTDGNGTASSGAAASNESANSETTADAQCGGGSATSVVGGIMGGVLFAALAGLATVLWLWRREHRERLALQQQVASMVVSPTDGARSMSKGPQKRTVLVEADDSHQRLEMPTRTDDSPQHLELPAGNY